MPQLLLYRKLTSKEAYVIKEYDSFEELFSLIKKYSFYVPKSREELIWEGIDLGGYKRSVAMLLGELDHERILKTRHCVILDMEGSDKSILDCNVPFSMIHYFTARHRPNDEIRERVIIETTRSMTPDEYRIVVKNICDEYPDICFDLTAQQPTRLMFLPVVFQNDELTLHEGFQLDVDYYLNKTADTGVPLRAFTELKNKKDPREGDGIVNAFCRVYGIHEAIDRYLSHIYVDRDGDRYRHVDSSSAPGALVYMNTWFYSQHGNHDPAAAKHLNAWQLVELHLCKGSFADMCTLARNDDLVVAEMHRNLAAAIGTEDDTWLYRLERHSKTNQILPTYVNYSLIIENDAELINAFKYDELRNMQIINRDLLWRPRKSKGQSWLSSDDANLIIYIEKKYRSASEKHIRMALSARISQVSYNPLHDYFNSLPSWDGVNRVETMFIDYLGVNDSPLVRRMARMFMSAAYRRAFVTCAEEAIKWDIVPILYSRTQGIGKSMFCKRLGGRFFTDNIKEMSGDKDAVMSLGGRLIAEIAELAAIFNNKAGAEAARSFITREVDIIRPPYATNPVEKPRITCFIGTTNSRNCLTDPTGSRRFFPMQCSEEIDFFRIEAINNLPTDQLWAETKECLLSETLYFNLEETKEQERISEAFKEEYSYIPLIYDWLDKEVPPNWNRTSKEDRRLYWNMQGDSNTTVPRDRVSIHEIWYECLGRELDTLRRTEKDVLDRALHKVGWVLAKARGYTPYGKVEVYIKEDNIDY